MEKVINLGDKLEEGNGQCWEGAKRSEAFRYFPRKKPPSPKNTKRTMLAKINGNIVY